MTDSDILVILGAGGLAREIAQLVRVLDGVAGISGRTIHLVDRTAEDEILREHRGLIAIGVGDARKRLAILNCLTERCREADLMTLVHPRADLGDTTLLAPGVVVTSGVVTTVDVAIGEATYLNWNVTVGHDCVINKACVVNPGATISGGVTLGNGVLIGTGANLIEGVSVGDNAIVGAGSVVTRDVPAGVTVVGAPARVVTS